MREKSRAIGYEPCPECKSKDNLARYEDGGAYCFGCKYWEAETDDGSGDTVGVATPDPVGSGTSSKIEVDYVSLPVRGISQETCQRFKYGIGTNSLGQAVQVAAYGNAQKLRKANKKFNWINRPEEGPGFFGQNLWRPSRRLVITEGEIDALSYAEATGCKYPVVSVPDGCLSATKTVADQIEWVLGFEEVIFLFDMDEPGQLAAVECAELLPPGRAFIGTLPRKDANETLLECGTEDLYKAPFRARPYRPDGIVEGIDLIDDVLEVPEMGLSYPWECLTSLLHGQRLGNILTWAAGTGTGKTQVLREISHHLWTVHKKRVGIISLEESNRNSAEGQISLAMNKKLHLPSVRETVPDKEIKAVGKRILPGFAFYDHVGSRDAVSILPKIRYMAHTMGIKYFVLDHVSIMISGSAAGGDERKELDELCTALQSICSELDITINIVTHLRRPAGTPHEEGGQVSLADIRSSGILAQVSTTVIGLERNQQAEDGTKNNTVLRVLKNRFTGETGVAGVLGFNQETGRLSEEDAFVEDNESEGEGEEGHANF